VFSTSAALDYHPLIDIKADPCELHGAQIRYFVAAVINYGVYFYARSSGYTEVSTPLVLLAKSLHVDDRIPTIIFSEA
jgi:hypothetical protein